MIDLTAELDSMQRWAYYGLETETQVQTQNLASQEVPMTNELTTTETQQLAGLEATIEAGLNTFVDVGQALLAIRDRRLYRTGYPTFDDYCRRRWGINRAHGYRLIEAAQVVSSLQMSPIGDTPLPANESQARPLSALPPDQQALAWQQAVETAPGGKLTAAHVQQTVDSFSYPSEGAGGEGQRSNVPTFQRSNPSQPFQLIMSQDSEEWYTPEEYIEMARLVMSGIDLDPATSLIAQQWIRATVYYTIADDGLAQPWLGRAWVNPPYTKNGEDSKAEIWSTRLLAEYHAGRVTEAILLVNNKAGYKWFENVWDQALACFARDLIRFIRPDGSRPGKAKVGSVFFYLGPNTARFAEVFGKIGRVVTSEGNLL